MKYDIEVETEKHGFAEKEKERKGEKVTQRHILNWSPRKRHLVITKDTYKKLYISRKSKHPEELQKKQVPFSLLLLSRSWDEWWYSGPDCQVPFLLFIYKHHFPCQHHPYSLHQTSLYWDKKTKSASYTEPSLQFTNHSVLFILAKINIMFIILTMLESCPSAT